MSEKLIQTEIIKYLQSLGWKVIKTVVLSKSGDADLICCDTKGMFWAIEVKDLKEKPRPLQITKLLETQRIGGNACSVSSLKQLKGYISNGVPYIEDKKIIFSL